jgi:starch phosphorylase
MKQPDKGKASIHDRWLGMDQQSVALDIARHFHVSLGREISPKSRHYLYSAVALAVRDRLIDRMRTTRDRYRQPGQRRVAYLSMEFLMGRMLNNAVLNLDAHLDESIREALREYDCDFQQLAEEEFDAGLGNGGLGRLAACFLDSCATLGYPVTGYGLRYQYGMFHQRIENGFQVEYPDQWLKFGNPWEIPAPEFTRRIHFGGRTESYADVDGRLHVRWINTHDVLAVPYDVPVPGFHNDTVNTLRLWKAQATDAFDLEDFNAGDYTESVAAKNAAEQITMVLYPNDASESGKELRLRQQYFLASASLQDVLSRWAERNDGDFSEFAACNAFQLNDTHPSVAVAELMRLLMDVYEFEWDGAWEITRSVMAYTNHTLLPEALERWPVRLFRELLPRLLEIIYEINARFMADVEARWPGHSDRLARMSIIEEGADPQVRMAHLAVVGSYSVNGVAELHTRLLEQGLFRDFYELWPEKFNNKTNGVTPRRWLAHCNPALAGLISERIGDGWLLDLERLEDLRPAVDDAAFRERWHAIKQANKARLVELVARRCQIEPDVAMLFDVQVKRLHEYKRQLLNCLHVIHLYRRVLRGDTDGMTPRFVLFGGKAAPGYAMAKLFIKLINNVAEIVNGDARARPWLQVAFLPDYCVTAMEVICPGTDLSEQISTAGKEASGTGNMKFMMSGALTIGTLDGANIEIREAVGAENFFLFGLRADEVVEMRRDYDPASIIAADADLAAVMNLLESGAFNRFEPGLFAPIIESLRSPADPWMTVADFRGFVDAQEQAASAYRDRERWTRMSILNTAASGRFSSDRTIREYARDIWRLEAPG